MSESTASNATITVEYNVTIAAALGASEETYAATGVATINDLLAAIRQRHGETTVNTLLDSGGQLLTSVLAAVNDQQPAERAAATINPGDRVLFLSVVGGG